MRGVAASKLNSDSAWFQRTTRRISVDVSFWHDSGDMHFSRASGPLVTSWGGDMLASIALSGLVQHAK